MNLGGRPRGKTKPKPDPRLAPGSLATVQAFLNTARSDAQSEQLSTPHRLARWLTRHTLLPASAKLTEDDRKRAIDVREGIRALVRLNVGGKIDARTLERLDSAISRARFQLRFDPDATFRFEPATPGIEDALAKLLEIVVVESRFAGLWPRLKPCANPGCGRAFYDASKSRTGRWCTKRCGDKIKARYHRRRARAKGY